MNIDFFSLSIIYVNIMVNMNTFFLYIIYMNITVNMSLKTFYKFTNFIS